MTYAAVCPPQRRIASPASPSGLRPPRGIGGSAVGLLAGSLIALAIAPALAQITVPEALIKAAQAEGSVTLYSSADDRESKALLAAFEQQYGIKGTSLRLASMALMQRFSAEAESGTPAVDVLSIAGPVPFETNAKWFVPLDASQVPHLAAWPKRWVGDNFVTWATNIFVSAVNTDQVSEAATPKVWTDVLDPKWKGKILLSDPRIADNYFGWLDSLETKLGADFLKKLAAQDFKLTQSGASGAQMVAAGAYPINFPTLPSFSTELIARKAPIAIRPIGGPTLVSVRNTGLVAHAPHPNAARLFLDWSMSEEGVAAACKSGDVAMVADPEGKKGCVPVSNPEPVNFTLTDARRQELLYDIGLAN